MKKIIHTIIISSCLLLTGCWDRKEVNDIGLVLGVAIDKSEDNQIELTLQILIPRTAGSGQQGASGGGGSQSPMFSVKSVIGENIADAASKLEGKYSRTIFWGHCTMYIIGEELAKEEGIRKQLDFLLRHPEPRGRAYLYISKGKAANFLEKPPSLEPYTGEGLRKLSEKHIGIDTTLKDVSQMLSSDAKAGQMPFMNTQPEKEGEEGKQVITITETAILKNDKMVGYVDEYTTRGLLWLRNEGEVKAITVKLDKDQSVSIDPIRQSIKLVPAIENGKWKITGKISLDGNAIQNEATFDMMDPEIIKKVEKEAEKRIKQRINQTLNQIQKEMKVDVFGFAETFHRRFPRQWENVKNHWDDIFPEVEVTLDVNVKIRRSGLSTSSPH
ncbi:Ger(x)C family spore germination protein [Bacillaceae bacterium Marseille-Q3522]|nr:Ger(x)C family spore germination protein [Bacillaceae bacterium Marseille-Q3522]